MNDFYYLSHGGPGSGRYPLGSGERPYQKFEGKRSKGGITGYIRMRKAKKNEEQRQKQHDLELQRKKEEEEKKRRHEADKERVLREGSPEEIMKYKGELTNKERQEAAERLRLERQIEGYAKQDIKTSLEKMKKIQSYTNVSSLLAKDGIDIWNSFASVYNVTDNGKRKPLPLIGKGEGKKNK